MFVKKRLFPKVTTGAMGDGTGTTLVEEDDDDDDDDNVDVDNDDGVTEVELDVVVDDDVDDVVGSLLLLLQPCFQSFLGCSPPLGGCPSLGEPPF